MTACVLRVALTLSILVASFVAEAQQATKVHRIGRLSAGPPTLDPNPSLEAFRQGLHDLGYVEGQNLVIEHRYAEGSQERLRDLATELVRLHVDLIVAGGSASIHAAQQSKDCGAAAIQQALAQQGIEPMPSRRTIYRILHRYAKEGR